MTRLLGQGFELGVFAEGDRLILGIPVASGFASHSFDFEIKATDLHVLQADPRRRLTLDLLLHETLQPRITSGATDVRDDEHCCTLIQTVLHGTLEAIEAAIDQSPTPALVRTRLKAAGFE